VPLYFGAAHLHHLYELVTLQRRPIAAASQQVRFADALPLAAHLAKACSSCSGSSGLSAAPVGLVCEGHLRARRTEEFFRIEEEVPLSPMQVLAQFLYTSIFGWYATWLFVRSGHLAAPIVVHALCNLLGFPDFDRMTSHPAAPLLTGATAAGIGLFGVLLRPLTDPGKAEVSVRVTVDCTDNFGTKTGLTLQYPSLRHARRGGMFERCVVHLEAPQKCI